MFLHALQCDNKTKWDDALTDDELREWRNISQQVNSASPVHIARYIGKDSDTYQLIACTDSSKLMCGIVLYLLNNNKSQMSFLLAKSKIVGKQLENKSIPCLELLALSMGVETLIDVYDELSGNNCVKSVIFTKMKLFTDSHVCLNWLQGCKFAKTNKLSVFVKNRLIKISNLCRSYEIEFRFCSGIDFMTRTFYDENIFL